MAQRIPTGNKQGPDRKVAKARRKTVSGATAVRPGASAAPAAAHAVRVKAMCQVVGSFFRDLREKQKLTQDQVAAMTRELGFPLSRATISATETGRHMPGLDAAAILSGVYREDVRRVIERLDLVDPVPVDLSAESRETLSLRAYDAFKTGHYLRAVHLYVALRDRSRLDPSPDPLEREREVAEVEIRIAAALRQRGALSAAEEAAKRATRLAERHSDLLSQAYGVLATIMRQSGFLALALDFANRSVEVAVGCDDKVQGRAWLGKGNVLFESGRYEEAHAALSSAREKMLRAADPVNLVHVERSLGQALQGMGDVSRARTWLNRSVERARKESLPLLEAHSLTELGRLSLEEGKLDEAEQCALSALRLARPSDHALAIFRGVWLQLRVAERKHPGSEHRDLVASLHKLRARIQEHRGDADLTEFESSSWSQSTVREGRTS